MVLAVSCVGPKSANQSPWVRVGDAALAVMGYQQEAESGWEVVLRAKNHSSAPMACMAYSYTAGMAQGSRSVVARNLDGNRLPLHLEWAQHEPEFRYDSMMMERYGIGHVFELQPGEERRFTLPIYVPQASPDRFVEHFIFHYQEQGADLAESDGEIFLSELIP